MPHPRRPRADRRPLAALPRTGGSRQPAILRAALAVLLWSALALPAQAVTAISINLCTDQLLLAVADPDQILGLSPYARDMRSWMAVEAARYPVLSGTAEEVLVRRPDLVLAGRYTKRATRELLKSENLRVVEFDATSSIADAKRQIAEVGRLMGHPDRSAARIAAIDGAIARARQAASVRPISVLPLQRRGWVSGRDTLITSILTTLGLRNAGSDLSGRGRHVTLESIVALKPDLLLVSSAEGRADDQGTALLEHPALRGLYPAETRLVLPERLIACGGPMLAEALDMLAGQIEARR